jgi:hypothetical protein
MLHIILAQEFASFLFGIFSRNGKGVKSCVFMNEFFKFCAQIISHNLFTGVKLQEKRCGFHNFGKCQVKHN